MTPIYARYRDTLVERVGERWVDPFLMALIRYHAKTEEDRHDLVDFCVNPVMVPQFALLLRHMGRRNPLMANELLTDVWENDRIITCRMEFGEGMGVTWNRKVLTVHGHAVPDTMAIAAVGKSLGALIDHPYIPAWPTVSQAITSSSNLTLMLTTEHELPIGGVA